ncbi:hypothetical protein F4678DRAFT_274192 [Xylaria arbuscula]|nr:hypothetical protein F4678DRAFT_274192 [Xylaria arbuscula]
MVGSFYIVCWVVLSHRSSSKQAAQSTGVKMLATGFPRSTLDEYHLGFFQKPIDIHCPEAHLPQLNALEYLYHSTIGNQEMI